jgi:protein-tyrosine phosphatase
LAPGILFVCYANLCRSPMAEFIARGMLSREWAGERIPVSSVGTHAVPGYRMHPHSATVIAGLGADPTTFRSRSLSPEAVAEAGLVLAATRRERAACVSLVPAAMHRAFTLRQFGRLAATACGTGPATPWRDPGGPLSAVVSAVRRARGQLQPVGPEEDDLADPVGQPLPVFQRCASEIEAALAPVVKLIAAFG